MYKNILITGGVGFIGINATKEFLINSSFEKIIVLDDLKLGQKIEYISMFKNKRIIFIKGDINNQKLISAIFKDFEISHIVHLAAESHVDNSINHPNEFVYSNILGTYNLIELFRLNWYEHGRPPGWRFLYLSTDEVFGSLDNKDDPFNESSKHNPSSPYSATKSSAEQLVKAWNKTYGLPIIVINCTNNYGPYQYAEKLIPLVIKNILEGKEIPVYGNGNNVRDWIHVSDHCKGIRMVLEKGKIGESYCIGSNSEITNIDLIRLICNKLDALDINLKVIPSFKLVNFTRDRLGHDFRYALSCEKIKNEIKWEPKYKLSEGLNDAINWYLENPKWLKII